MKGVYSQVFETLAFDLGGGIVVCRGCLLKRTENPKWGRVVNPNGCCSDCNVSFELMRQF
jgi:hypothetical protein